MATKKATNWPPKSVLEPGGRHKWENTVAFDFHEVIVSFMAQFAKVLNSLYPGANLDPSRLEYYHPGFDPKVNIGPQEFERAFNFFVELSKGGYGDLPLIPGMKEALERIKGAGIGIQIVTYVPGFADLLYPDRRPHNTGTAQQATLDLIEKLGLPIDVTPGSGEVKFIKPWEKAYHLAYAAHIPLIVEDNRTTASSVSDLAHAAILRPTSWNKCGNIPNVLRLDERKDLPEEKRAEAISAAIADEVIAFYAALRDNGKLRGGS
jgi:hypothetical protein